MILNLTFFKALGRHKETDETPYVVPDLFTQMNNNVLRTGSKLDNNVLRTGSKLGSSLTQDDLRLHDSGVSSQHSGESYYANQRVHETRIPSNHMINKSKSAHVISCEVYSEVIDHTGDQPCHMSTLKRRPGHWNVDSLRQLDTDLIVSPGCNRYVKCHTVY